MPEAKTERKKTVKLAPKEPSNSRESEIFTWAKSITLVLLGISLSFSICVSVFKTDNGLQTLKEMLPVITGVLAFIGGRSGR